MISVLTAAEIANNYPDQFLITSQKDQTGKFAAYAYRLKGKDIHKLLVSTNFVFETGQEAEEYIHEIFKEIVANYVFGI